MYLESVCLPPFTLKTLLMMSVKRFFHEHIKPQKQIYVRGDDRNKIWEVGKPSVVSGQ